MATPKIGNEFASLTWPAMDMGNVFAEFGVLMLTSVLIAAPGVFLASVLRGFTGFGFGLAAVPLLSLVLPPARVVTLVVLLQVIVGASDLRQAWRLCDWRAIGGLLPGLALGIPTGLAILIHLPANPVRLVIGVVIAASVILLWRGAHLPRRPTLALTMSVGAISGTISGLSSMGGPPVVVYLIAMGHSAAVVRATLSVYFMISGLLSGGLMVSRGMIDAELLLWTAVSLPALFLGSWAGTWGFHKASPRQHRMTALWVLALLAAGLILRALTGA